MTKTALAVLLAVATAPAFAQVKDCDELKGEIDAKITANGVKVFTTSIVDMDAPEVGKVVGTCGGQTKKILYQRGVMPPTEGAAATPAGESATPAGASETPTSKQ